VISTCTSGNKWWKYTNYPTLYCLWYLKTRIFSAKSRLLTTDYKAKTNKIRDFAYGRYGMRKLGFFQQKL
jgi:hypothetical protein